MINNTDITPTKTPETEANYVRVYKMLHDASKKQLEGTDSEVKEGETLDPSEVVKYFLKNRVQWKPATERLYRASIFHHLEPQRHTNSLYFTAHHRLFDYTNPLKAGRLTFTDNKAKQEALDDLVNITLQRKKNEEDRQRKKHLANTSGQKAKHILADDIAKLMEAFDRSSSKWKNNTKVWFQAAALTGLRPIEWANSSLTTNEKGELALKVLNAKTTNNRSFGDFRTLGLQKLKPEEIEVISQQVKNAQIMEDRGHFNSWFEACRNLIKLISRELWPNRMCYPTLYTARHIFAANAKVNLTRKEVAALMGHGSELTAGHHYARRSSASGSMNVTPSEEDMNALTARNGVTSQEPRTNDWLKAKQDAAKKSGNSGSKT